MEAELTYPHNIKQGLQLTKKAQSLSPPRQALQKSAAQKGLHWGAPGPGGLPSFWPADQATEFSSLPAPQPF